jgi:hypothetical protein
MIRLSQVPQEHLNKAFKNLLDQRGLKESWEVVKRDSNLISAFDWHRSDQGFNFWDDINEGKDPVTSTTTTTSSLTPLEEAIAEAERRGFANGVLTKNGEIRERFDEDSDILDHDLREDGSFFYRNIRVRNSKGKWIKPNVEPKKGYTERDIQEDMDAIHAMLDKVFKFKTN